LLPKWALDVNGHEIARGARLSNCKTIEYISFRLPNRTGQFQADLYPEFPGNKPAADYNQWAAGEDKPAILSQLKP